MTEPISPELFSHLVSLAALELSNQESEYLRQQLNNQLKAINELADIPLDPNIPPALHGIQYSPAFRPPIRGDFWQPSELADSILEQAPEVEERFIIVPDIPHQDLE